jgi:hypothetical protein
LLARCRPLYVQSSLAAPNRSSASRQDLKTFVGMKSRDHPNDHLRQLSAKGDAQKDLRQTAAVSSTQPE